MASVLKNGSSYRIRVSLGYDADGKQKIVSKTWRPEPGMTPAQIEKGLEKQKVDFEREANLGTALNRNVRFSEFTERWLETYCRPNLRSHTVRNYKNILIRLNAVFGNKKIGEIEPYQIAKFYNELGTEKVHLPVRYKAKKDFGKYLKARKITKLALSNSSGVSRNSINNLCSRQSQSCAPKSGLTPARYSRRKTVCQSTPIRSQNSCASL